jgi:glycosyltransferase involved in cell wall biosynthesis
MVKNGDSMKNKYIIDITQLVHWQGRLTGIPRVMQELAVRFNSQEKETVFVSWVKEVGDMCEVDFESTMAIRGSGIEYVKKGTSSSKGAPQTSLETPVEPTKLSLTRRSKNFAKKVLRRIGADDNKIVTQFRASLYQKNVETYARLIVSKGDIFLIPAGEWWDENFINLVLDYASQGVKIVQVSHDLLPIVTPQFSGHATESLSNYNSKVIPIASLVLANSQSTKNDLIEWLKAKNLQGPKIEVFRIGEDFTFEKPTKPTDEIFNKAGLTGNDFIISVGTIEARKNHALLYYTYKLAVSKGINLPKLLIIGRKGWMTEDIYHYITNDPDTKDILLPLHDISDSELSWLYNHSLFTIYPSYYEGWGMPIAESITRGVPCLASNTSSMPEVAPGFAHHFTPSSTDELLDGIINMLKPGNLDKERAKLKGYKSTTWDDSFAQVLGYLEKL